MVLIGLMSDDLHDQLETVKFIRRIAVKIKIYFVLFSAIFFVKNVEAAKGIRVQNLQTSHNTTFLTLETARLNDQPFSEKTTEGRIYGYFDYSWVNDPWIDLDDDGKTRIGSDGLGGSSSLIKNAQVLNLGVGYLINSNLQIGIELPIESLTTEDQGVAPINSSLDGTSTTGLGDLRLFANWNFLNTEYVSMSVIPTLYLPTGFYAANGYYAKSATCSNCEPTTIGASWASYGAGVKIALENMNKYFTTSINFGIDHHPEAFIEGKKNGSTYKKVNFETQYPVAIGFFVPVAKSFGINLEGTTNSISNVHNEYTHPGEALVGVRYWPQPDIATHLTVGTGSLENIGGNDPRFILGVKLPLYMPAAVSKSVVTNSVVTVSENNKIELLKNVEFELGNAKLTTESKKILDEIIVVLKNAQDNYKRVTIEGHTDHRGSVSLNKKLSIDRALAVKNYLIENGIPKEKLSSEGFGSSQPKYNPKKATPTQIDLNRRVEFKLAK
jgi:outer membrane protein OmpA-like peptidoglycan-associated protein